ncbi:hypothetical protein HDZ31DRAFT_60946 [Schizophyllum fasciatum]
MPWLASLLSLSLLAGAAPVAEDPCAVIAGRPYAPPVDVLACWKSFPFNETLRQNVLTNVARVFDFFTFENYYLDSPPPFEESTVNVRDELQRLNSTTYETDYDFNWDLFLFATQLNDGHTRWYPDCYTSFQNLLPTPIVALSTDGECDPEIFVAPDSVEFITLLGTNYTSYFDSIGFDWKRLAGAKVTSIEGQDPWDYVDYLASTISGNYLDHGVRVNSVFTSYRVSSNDFSQRFGDFAGPTGVARTSVKISAIPTDTGEEETFDVPYYANLVGNNFTDSKSYWANNCAANQDTNGQDYKDLAAKVDASARKAHLARAELVDKSNATAVGLPEKYRPDLPPAGGSKGVLKNYILEDGVTGVMFVGSFGGEFDQFQTDTESAIREFKSKGVTRLLIDLTNNGGGYVCLGQFLHNYLAGADIPYDPGFISSHRANELALKIVANDIKLGLNSSYGFYAPDNYAFLANDTAMPATYNYMDPTEPLVINGVQDPTSQRFYDTCALSYTVEIPAEPPFPLDQVAIVNNGNCASTCAMFSTLMFEHYNTKIAAFGGGTGHLEYKGMAGNQVLEWADLASEIKTADLENDPLAPPDLLISGNMRQVTGNFFLSLAFDKRPISRVNWRTAWSWLEKDEPIAYRSEPPQVRLQYTNETYISPQKLWEFAASKLF